VLGLEKNRIEISSAKLDFGRSSVEATGAIEGLTSPKAAFRFTAHVGVDQAGNILKWGFARQGMVDLAGSAQLQQRYRLRRHRQRQRPRHRSAGGRHPRLRRAPHCQSPSRSARSEARWRDRGRARRQFTGRAEFPKLVRFMVDGSVRDMPIDRTLATLQPDLPTAQTTSWSGLASGPVHIEGGLLRGSTLVATAKVYISPGSGGIPVQGSVDLRYDTADKTLNLAKSHIETPGANVDLSGTLGTSLEVSASSTNLNELLPVINVFAAQPVKSRRLN